jgi:hypothetical protein
MVLIDPHGPPPPQPPPSRRCNLDFDRVKAAVTGKEKLTLYATGTH